MVRGIPNSEEMSSIWLRPGLDEIAGRMRLSPRAIGFWQAVHSAQRFYSPIGEFHEQSLSR